jgi:hypothetical protein
MSTLETYGVDPERVNEKWICKLCFFLITSKADLKLTAIYETAHKSGFTL